MWYLMCGLGDLTPKGKKLGRGYITLFAKMDEIYPT
jgi:hypothetical protein